jgi:hypothetical protein
MLAKSGADTLIEEAEEEEIIAIEYERLPALVLFNWIPNCCLHLQPPFVEMYGVPLSDQPEGPLRPSDPPQLLCPNYPQFG